MGTGRLRAGWAAAAITAACITSPAAAKADCAAMAKLALPDGEVTSATLVPAGSFQPPQLPGGPPPGVAAASFQNLPEFCRIQATRRPSADSDIKVEVWLPATGWNGKFAAIGNGIWAGSISYFEMGRPLARGYAVAATDTGHTGNGMTADFAVGHPEKLKDFGYRAVHEMVVTAKAAIAAFYGRGPQLSLWNSCSTGGRQGLMAAHRYPEDFDAISAMAPANPMTNLMTQSMWVGYQPNRAPAAKLSRPKLMATHQAVLKQCDKLDGLEDGLISRPDLCSFDPVSIQCKAGDGDSCLTAEQVGTMRAVYDGVRDSSGAWLLPGFPRGSEMQLGMLMMSDAPFPVADTFFSMLVYGDKPGWTFRQLDYGQGLRDARRFADILDVPADGLDPFFARGGKLLLSHGWNDGLIPATNTLAFYHDLYAALPAAQAEQQLRLFMVPGMEHCAGGEGVSQFDTLGTIDDWAAGGAAPMRLVATRAAPMMPGAPELPPLSRPLCAWPMVAQYNGSGDPSEAANFSCVVPKD
ncbi:tannase/feruloyl esterase family alpha/beta hydrolase [Altererythrobacter sp. B11]|uniref:tannase/feruloyl esterase family alpha/beta hydrolase n=1 Tax=Altererythrobacter sp. B11 TaxID=2060312 RepID=UPI000E5BCC37|nr:tannase/feruloyl esterase family alpha/beta hydrolase [Altererythrobacter sp. B11]